MSYNFVKITHPYVFSTIMHRNTHAYTLFECCRCAAGLVVMLYFTEFNNFMKHPTIPQGLTHNPNKANDRPYGLRRLSSFSMLRHTQTVVWYVEEEFLRAEHLVSGTRWCKWVGGGGGQEGTNPPTPSASGYCHHSKSDPTPLYRHG